MSDNMYTTQEQPKGERDRRGRKSEFHSITQPYYGCSWLIQENADELEAASFSNKLSLHCSAQFSLSLLRPSKIDPAHT